MTVGVPDSKVVVEDGVKRIISYSRNAEGKMEKHTRTYRTEVRKATASKLILERRVRPHVCDEAYYFT